MEAGLAGEHPSIHPSTYPITLYSYTGIARHGFIFLFGVCVCVGGTYGSELYYATDLNGFRAF